MRGYKRKLKHQFIISENTDGWKIDVDRGGKRCAHLNQLTRTQHNFQHFVDLILVIQTQTCAQVIAIKFIKCCIVFTFTPNNNLLVNVTTMAVSCNLADRLVGLPLWKCVFNDVVWEAIIIILSTKCYVFIVKVLSSAFLRRYASFI